jgi:putative FmdB family regulatory protein
MPTYAYDCGACGAQPEFFQGMTDPVKRKCPKCGKSKLVRRIGIGAGILFKGSGFYQTDYRSDSYKKAEAAEKPPSSDSKPSGEGKASDTAKPESKSSSASETKWAGETKSAGESKAKSDSSERKSSSKKK